MCMRKFSTASILTLLVVGIVGVFTLYPESVEPGDQSSLSIRSKGDKSHKFDEPGMFLKLHDYLETEAGKDFPEYKVGYQLREYHAAKEANPPKVASARSEEVVWDEKGPGNVSGRTPGLWIDPNDANHNTWVLGSSGGGIWLTEDGGSTWSSRTDNLPNLTVSDIRGSAANTDVLYAGTGKKFSSRIQGNGILKSTDRGRTWSVIESTLGDGRFVNVTRIAVNPANENELMASTFSDTNVGGAVSSHIMKSTDGGATWVSVHQTGNLIQQVVTVNDNFNIQFASVNGDEIMRSTDAGETWHTVFSVDSLHVSNQNLDRMEITISPVNSNRIFIGLYVDNEGEPDSELYMSNDQGNNWSRVIGKDAFNDLGNWLGGQGWYDHTMGAHPYIDTCVFVAGVSAILKITLDSARNDSLYIASMEVLADGYGEYFIEGERNVGSKGVHVDHHNLTLYPTNAETGDYILFNGNDGGLALSKDKGATFVQTGDTFRESETSVTLVGYNTVEFYGVDKKNGEDRYIAGSQDNGSWLSGADPGTSSTWAVAPSGDGFFAAWHYNNSSLILESSQFNDIYKTTDEGASWSRVGLPVSGGPFVTEIENSKQDPDLVMVASPDGVLRSNDFGDNWDVLDMPESWSYSGFVTPIAISLVNPDVVWSGSSIANNSRIAVSKDGGSTWEETADYTDANRGAVTQITTHPTDENTAYALFSQANGPKIIRSTDGGASWTDITGFNGNGQDSENGFPDVPTYSLVVMPFDTNIIWAGTSIGIVESLDGGATWNLKSDHNLPAVAVWDMRIVNDEVVIATHGRGIWSATLPELAGYEPPAVVLSPTLTAQEFSFSTTLAGRSILRSVYDSTQIVAQSTEFDDVIIYQDNGNDAGQVVDWSVDLEEALANSSSDQNIDIIHNSWSNGVLRQRSARTRVVRLNDAVNTFEHPIDGDIVGNFFIDGFGVSRSLSIEGNAFHSPHPYGDLSQYSFMIRTPFLLNADTAVLRYDDLALVEPGDDFGELFYDFVAIEAVKLPLTTSTPQWTRLIRYDARQHDDWLEAYNNETDPTVELFKSQAVDLYESGDFQQGDTILIRFLLESDPFVTGYGWVVDNVRFNHSTAVVLSTRNDQHFDFEVYPNPVVETASFKYHLETPGDVSIQVFSLGGHLINHVSFEKQAAGSHDFQIDASTLRPGVYMTVIRTDQGSETLKWIVRD